MAPKISKEVMDWENKLKSCISARQPFEEQWYYNLAFYFGRQYAIWEKGTTANRLVEPPAPRNRVRLISNKIKPVIRRELAKLNKEEAQFYVVPNTTEPTDIAAARAAESIADYCLYTGKYNVARRSATFWASLCGTSFIKTSCAGVDLPIEYAAVTPFHLAVPNIQEEHLENQPFVIHHRAVDPEVIYKFYNVEVRPDAEVIGATLEQRFFNAMGIKTNNMENEKNLVHLKEIWMKPCRNYPNGGLIVIAGGKVIYGYESEPTQDDPLNPRPVTPTEPPYEHGLYPFDKIDHIPTGRFYGDSVIVDLIPLQKEYNRTRSQVVEVKNRTAKPPMVYQKGSFDPTKVTSEPGQMIPIQPGFEYPQYMKQPEIPSYVMQEFDRITRDMDDISNQFEVAKGRTPPGVEAACVDSITQAFTFDGWKNYSDLSVDDFILTYDKVTNTTKFAPVNALNVYQYSGDMIKMNSQFFDAVTTPNHKWLVKRRHVSRGYADRFSWKSKRADRLAFNDSIPFARPVSSGNYNVKKEYAELLGWIISDGNFNTYSYEGKSYKTGIKIHQSTVVNQDKCNTIQGLFNSLDIEYSTNVDDNGIQVWYIFEDYAAKIRQDIPNKKINVSLFSSWHPELIQSLVDGLMGGDGMTSESGQELFYTSQKEDAESFRDLNLLLGKSVGICEMDRPENTTGKYFACTIKKEKYNKAIVGYANKKTVQYDGIVWCPTVDTGFWVAKRNNSIYITGNSAIAYLQEENDDVLNPTTFSIETATESVGKKTLGLVQQFWSDNKLIKVVSRNSAQEVMVFKVADMKDNTDIRVEAGSMAPRSRAAKQAFITELMKMGVIDNQTGLRYLQMNETNRLYEETQVDSRHAQRENIKMSQKMVTRADPNTGEEIPVGFPTNDFDNDAIHEYEHGLYMKSQEFELLSDELKAQFLNHYMLHKGKLLAQQLQQPGIQPDQGGESVAVS